MTLGLIFVGMPYAAYSKLGAFPDISGMGSSIWSW